MGVIAQQQVDVFGNRFGVFPNPALKNKDGTDKSWLDHTVTYFKEAGNAFRGLQLGDRICRVVSMVLKDMGNAMSGFFDDLAGKLSLGWAILTFPRLPSVTQTAWKAIADWGTPSLGPVASASRGILQKIHDIADALAAWGYGLSLVLGNSALKNAADVPNFVADVTDLSMASEDYSLAKKHLEYINTNHADNGALQQRFVDTMREALLRIVKSVASVVSGVLGLLVLAFGGPVIPAAALLGIGLTSTVAAMANWFFKETAVQEKVEFFKFRSDVLVDGVRVN